MGVGTYYDKKFGPQRDINVKKIPFLKTADIKIPFPELPCPKRTVGIEIRRTLYKEQEARNRGKGTSGCH